MNYQKGFSITGLNTGHVQGIAIDAKREFMYFSFTTSLIKTDMKGNIIGSVEGLCGHLGCIAYDYSDGSVWGSLEFKLDSIGKGILNHINLQTPPPDGFYAVRFDCDKITRPHMNAEEDGVMTAVFLKEVLDDYKAPGHRHGCSGIDGVTFAPKFGQRDGEKLFYVAYGIYSETEREDNDYQVILSYSPKELRSYLRPLNQLAMHTSGPEKPLGKYFLYTGNTTYGIQNLEYDPYTNTHIVAVYQGQKPSFPNYPIFFIDQDKEPKLMPLKGYKNTEGMVISLCEIGEKDERSGVWGLRQSLGDTGVISLGDGYYYFSRSIYENDLWGSEVSLYRFDKKTGKFIEA